MPEADDIQLLRDYAERQSEAAFAELVRRHVNLVYSCALRQTGNAHQAEEITQAVFIILARKTASLGRKTILSGWLYQTARLTAANFLRTERRRGTGHDRRSPDPEQARRQIRENGLSLEDGILFPMIAEHQQKGYAGYRVLSQQSPSANETVFEVETAMASGKPKTETLKFQQVNGDWKVVVDEAQVQAELSKAKR